MTASNDKAIVVLCLARLGAGWLERLQQTSPNLRIEKRSPDDWSAISADLWREVQILYTFGWNLPAPDQVPDLRWVQLYSAGVNQVVNQPLFKTDVMFTTSSGIHAINIAEYVFTMILAWFHRLPSLLDWQRTGVWSPERLSRSVFLPWELWGKTIGIVGYGSIGRQVARLAGAFGMRILAMQRGADHRDHGFQFPGVGDPNGSLPARYYTPDQLPAMLTECDIVVIAVPSTSGTRGMFNQAAFQSMKNSAFLVNIARGDVCNQADLIQALQEKQIAGAALDVFEQEPLPSDSPLWHLPNVFLSPHISGLTPEYDNRVSMLFAENLRRYLSGQPLYNLVDKEQEY
ncbi:MAG TPA: D-2-hydroxyacid dehydrogenase [Ktedonobacteraceae bacterium]|jgi:phosphoglycerate dehydrogenase-like enzyme|nr:D-2-hydroxyacid dehydrogenase [Ktedonobacteraceae bacterium]